MRKEEFHNLYCSLHDITLCWMATLPSGRFQTGIIAIFEGMTLCLRVSRSRTFDRNVANDAPNDTLWHPKIPEFFNNAAVRTSNFTFRNIGTKTTICPDQLHKNKSIF